MGERKVLNKYIPPDFDPANVGKKKAGNGAMNVRMMLPYTIVCNVCRSYSGCGTKFNMDKETVRDPQSSGYVVETGARVAHKNVVEDLCLDDNEIKDSMEELEKKAVKLKRGMVDLTDLELIKCVNKRQARVCEITDRALKRLKESSNCGEKDNVLNEEDEKLVRSIFGQKAREFGRKIDDEELDDGTWGGCKSQKKRKIEFSGKSEKKLSSVLKVCSGPKKRSARESRNRSVALQSLCQNYKDNGDE
ncbi:hypothetical protein OROMI_032173 [Orobanche minor]